MITNAPAHAYASRSQSGGAGVSPAELQDGARGFVVWFLGWLQRSVCALHGHDPMLQYERNRIFLRCTSCGHETPGWDVAQNTDLYHRDARGAENRIPRATPADLAIVRKIA